MSLALLALGIAFAIERRFFALPANVRGLNQAIREARRNPNYNIVCMGCYARCSHDHPNAEEARRCERLTAVGNDTTFGPFSWCRCPR